MRFAGVNTFALIFFSIGIFCFVTACSPDDQSAIRSCYVNYFRQFGLNSVPSTYEKFRKARDDLPSRNNDEETCRQTAALADCVHALSPNCSDANHLATALNVDPMDGAYYLADLEGMQHLCANAAAMKGGESCLEDLSESVQQECSRRAILTPRFTCNIAKDYVRCVAYRLQQCGPAVATAMCHVSVAYITRVYPMCHPLVTICFNS